MNISDQRTKGGRLQQMKYPTHFSTHRIVTYNYGTSGSIDDRLSRIAKLQHAGAGFVGTRDLSSYQHAGTGRLMDVRYLSASVSPEVYLDRGFSSGDYTNLDRFGRVKKQLWKTSSTTLDEFDYQHDLAGNRTSRDLPGNPLGQLYEYDGLDRLVDYDEGTISSGSIGSPTKGADWTLDGLGNWAGYEEQTAGSATLVQTRAHNKANEIGTITTTTGSSWISPLAYDAAGNLTEAPKPGVEAAKFKYIWDAWNRLAKITTNSNVDVAIFQYDGLHRRIGKSEQPSSEVWYDNHYYLSEQDQVVHQFRYIEDTKLHWHEFVWHPYYVDAMAARFYNTSAISVYYYPLHDANFNVTSVVDKDAGVVERYHYTPYGRTTFMNASFTPHGTQNTTINQQHLYTGRQRDAESELYYYRARYYHPTLGRFVNRDPIGYDGGDLNLYRYVGGNPPNAIDPSGLKLSISAEPKQMQALLDLLNQLCPDAGGFNGNWIGEVTAGAFCNPNKCKVPTLGPHLPTNSPSDYTQSSTPVSCKCVCDAIQSNRNITIETRTQPGGHAHAEGNIISQAWGDFNEVYVGPAVILGYPGVGDSKPPLQGTVRMPQWLILGHELCGHAVPNQIHPLDGSAYTVNDPVIIIENSIRAEHSTPTDNFGIRTY